MEPIGKFKIDELGRILLPSKLRNLLGWKIGSAIEMHYDGDNKAILQLAEEKSSDVCESEA